MGITEKWRNANFLSLVQRLWRGTRIGPVTTLSKACSVVVERQHRQHQHVHFA